MTDKRGSERRPITTQVTAKRWKAMQVAGIILFLVGYFLAVQDLMIVHEIRVWFWGLWLGIAGLILFIYGRFMAWWHHG